MDIYQAGNLFAYGQVLDEGQALDKD